MGLTPEARHSPGGSFHRFVHELLSTNRARLTTALLLMIVVGMSQGIGVLMVVPLLELLGLPDTAARAGGITGAVRSFYELCGLPLTLPTVLAAYMVIIALHGAATRWQMVLNARIDRGFIHHLRGQLHDSLMRAGWEFANRQRQSDTISLLTTELERIGASANHALTLVRDILVALIHIAIAITLSPVLALVAAGISAGLVALVWRQNRLIAQSGHHAHHLTQALHGSVMEHFSGMKIAKSFAAETSHIDRFRSVTGRLDAEFVRYVAIHSRARLIYQIGSVVALALMVYLAAGPLHIALPRLMLLMFIYGRLYPQCMQFLQGAQFIVNTLPAFDAVMLLHRQAREAREPAPLSETAPLALQRSLILSGVSYCYPGSASNTVLRNVDLCIPARQTTALTGPSGSGKSTLADILTGLIQPSEGQVLLDGEPLEGPRLLAWRHSVGYVPQDTFLFHDTVRGNLLWACPGADEQDLLHALRLAAADGFVSALPEGLDTVVGDRGTRLSGGERQRIALARALLRNPSLLLLDEATSSLDHESEKRIQQAISELHGKLTIVVIAHRKSSISSADKILVVDDGRVLPRDME